MRRSRDNTTAKAVQGRRAEVERAATTGQISESRRQAEQRHLDDVECHRVTKSPCALHAAELYHAQTSYRRF